MNEFAMGYSPEINRIENKETPLKEIAEFGWKNYRNNLINTNYADIINKYISEIEKNTDETKKSWYVEAKNQQLNTIAKENALKMSQELVHQYGKDKKLNFVAWQDRNKKLLIEGNNISEESRNDFCTRIYCATPTVKSPEAFKDLFLSLKQRGLLDKITYALNLETFNEDADIENNAIIVYIWGKNENLVNDVIKTIANTKEKNPINWQLNKAQKTKMTKSILKDFMIPLDESTGLIEQDNIDSYHVKERNFIARELTGDYRGRGTLRELMSEIKQYKVGSAQYFLGDLSKGIQHRRKYMPALIINK